MYFNLFSTCVIVEGAAASLICDLDRMDKYDVPKSVGELLALSRHTPIGELGHEFGETEDGMKEFLSQFVESELGFFTATPERFPVPAFEYETPFEITNAILEVDTGYSYNLTEVLLQLSALGCRAIQIIYRCRLTDVDPPVFLNAARDSRINQIEFLVPFDEDTKENVYYDLADKDQRISRFLIYAAPEDRIVLSDHACYDKLLIYRKKDIRKNYREIISPDRFTVNMDVFSEAQRFNAGLNRKVCIDKNGYIRNYPDHEKIFGNTNSDPIGDVIRTKEFQAKWNISNDQVEICKECQYRYCCISNSDIIMENGKNFKKNMCGFDPASNQWDENQKS